MNQNSGSGTSSYGNAAGGALAAGSAGLGIYQGLNKGGASGYAQAGIGAGNLANKAGAFGGSSSAAGAGLGAAGSALGIYNGIKQGGVAGYGSAAANSAQLAGTYIGAGNALGYAAIPFAAYDFAKNGTASGATGHDMATGAIDGASIGTAIMPGIGTVVGAVIGAAAGAISSAFGNGRVDPENVNFEGYTQAFNKAPDSQKAALANAMPNPYLPLAGYFDLRSNQLKGENPIYQQYGRMGEQKFTNDLISKVQQGKSVQGITDPNQMWNQVVQPWIQSMGNWNDSNKNAMLGLMQNMTGQIMSGTYKDNFKAVGGQKVFG